MKFKEKLILIITGIGAGILGMLGVFYKSNKDNKVVNKAKEDIAVSKNNDAERDTTIKNITKHQKKIKTTVDENEEIVKENKTKLSALQKRVAARKAREAAAKEGKKNVKKN